MQNDFIEEFKNLYDAVYAMYKRPSDPEPNPVVYELFYESIKSLGFDAVKKGFSVHIQSPDNGKWMPKPADIIRIIEGTSQDTAHIAWSKVRKSISVVGSYQTVVFDDPIIHRVIQDMGGWIRICGLNEKDISYTGHEFKNRYQAFKNQGEVPDYPAKLSGLHEGENQEYVDFIPKPIFIGDPGKARDVLRLGSNRPSLQITDGNNFKPLKLKRIGE